MGIEPSDHIGDAMSRPMSVVANLSWLVPGRVGGSEEYTVRLLEAVLALAPADIALRIVGSAALRDAHPGLAAAPFDVVPGPLGNRLYRIAAESTFVARATRDADVVHHFGGRVPLRSHGADIVTIHDLQPLHLPDNFSTVKQRYLARALPRAARTARLVCVPSAWVADTIVEAFGLAEDRVVPISSSFDPATDVDDSVAATLGAGRVVLFPAITHPHKNHLTLIAALDRLVDARPDLTLVLTGGAGRAEADVAAAVSRARVRVVRPGRVTAAQLRALVDRADVVAFPSRYEGFGLPVLEAMRAGRPVVAADAAALPEVVGDGGMLVDPDDVVGWAGAIEARLRAGRTESEAAAARAIVANHTPEAAAQRLLDAWRSVI